MRWLEVCWTGTGRQGTRQLSLTKCHFWDPCLYDKTKLAEFKKSIGGSQNYSTLFLILSVPEPGLGKGSIKKKKIREFSLRGGGASPIP